MIDEDSYLIWHIGGLDKAIYDLEFYIKNNK